MKPLIRNSREFGSSMLVSNEGPYSHKPQLSVIDNNLGLQDSVIEEDMQATMK